MFATLVTGEIRFPSDAAIPEYAVAHVHLLDVSLADAPSRRISEHVINNVGQLLSRGERVTFSLRAEIDDPFAYCIVDVHVDVDRDGHVSRGDYISVQSYPIATRGNPTHAEVTTVQVT